MLLIQVHLSWARSLDSLWEAASQHIPAERVKVAPGFRAMPPRMGHDDFLLPVIESFRLEKIFKTIESNRKPNISFEKRFKAFNV